MAILSLSNLGLTVNIIFVEISVNKDEVTEEDPAAVIYDRIPRMLEEATIKRPDPKCLDGMFDDITRDL